MNDFSHSTEPDEALRQVRVDEPIRDSLRWIANKLRARRPQALMTEGGRIAIALSAAYMIHPNDDTAAEALERELLQRMPYVDRPITRGEFALLLNKKSWGE